MESIVRFRHNLRLSDNPPLFQVPPQGHMHALFIGPAVVLEPFPSGTRRLRGQAGLEFSRGGP